MFLKLFLVFSFYVNTIEAKPATQNIKNKCITVKAAFDIGSGSTKIKVARINTCKGKILKYLLEKQLQVSYKESIKKRKYFSKKIMKKGLKSLRKLKKLAEEFKPSKYIGVATAAFRNASNSKQFIDKLNQQLNINIKIISQEEEAKLGFYAGVASQNKNPQSVVVWDIGGGSMQITAYSKRKQFSVYKGQLASNSFKNLIISKIKKKNIERVSTPNPISLKEMNESLKLALSEAKNVPPFIKKKIKSGSSILGIGGVHYYSIRAQLKNKNAKFYTYKEIEKIMKASVGKPNAKEKYASSKYSNLILIFAYMKELGIKKVALAKINLADGLLLQK